MILITGGTGFIGKALTRRLVEAGFPVRLLLRPSAKSPDLPKGVPVEVAVSSLTDERGLRAAMVGVEVIYHLTSAERVRGRADLWEVDIRAAQAVARAAAESKVDRFIYLSHIGADRASAYGVLKAKAIAEEHIRRSGVDYTIFRSAVVFGPGDSFTTSLARLISAFPFIFLMPGDGKTLLQPLWIEDLVTCLIWTLDIHQSRNQSYEIGGPEQLTLQEVVEIISAQIGKKRTMVPVHPPYMRSLTVTLEHLMPRLPVSVFWLYYFASNHICRLDSLPRNFNLLPARFSHRLAYLNAPEWKQSLFKIYTGRRSI
jgi:uncharacterized protein YbjT (DUF2867 family)